MDLQLFNLGNNPNPSLSKNIAFGDASSEENMTFTQLLALINSNLLPVDTWHEMGLGTNWSAAAGINRPGVFYRKSKAGLLEMSFSCQFSGIIYNQNIFNGLLPEGYRPGYNTSITTFVWTSLSAAYLATLDLSTGGSATFYLKQNFTMPFYFTGSFVIPL